MVSGRLKKISSTENETLNVSIDTEEIKEIVNQEWRKSNGNLYCNRRCILAILIRHLPAYLHTIPLMLLSAAL